MPRSSNIPSEGSESASSKKEEENAGEPTRGRRRRSNEQVANDTEKERSTKRSRLSPPPPPQQQKKEHHPPVPTTTGAAMITQQGTLAVPIISNNTSHHAAEVLRHRVSMSPDRGQGGGKVGMTPPLPNIPPARAATNPETLVVASIVAGGPSENQEEQQPVYKKTTIQREPLRGSENSEGGATHRESAKAKLFDTPFEQLHFSSSSPPLPVHHRKRSSATVMARQEGAHHGLWDRLAGATLVLLGLLCTATAWWVAPSSTTLSSSTPETAAGPSNHPYPPHIILTPKQQHAQHRLVPANEDDESSSYYTLRDFLTDESTGFHLAMAPSFFGFYGYFGALAAWEEQVDEDIFAADYLLESVVGASAGAMAAILLAAGVSPQEAATFCTTVTLDQFADFPGLVGIFQGNKFEQTMHDFLRSQLGPDKSLLLQDSVVPVAVSAFDLQTMEGQILQRGSMARAARASATFPLLFQPVSWKNAAASATKAKANTNSSNSNINNNQPEDFVFVDGGLADFHGMLGLQAFLDQSSPDHADSSTQRVVNLIVGGGFGSMAGPSALRKNDKVAAGGGDVVEVVSVTLQNLPQCGPWNLEDGPKTVQAARLAMAASLDIPLFPGTEENHYELHIDTSSFWKR